MFDLFLLPIVMIVVAVVISRQAQPGRRLRAAAIIVGGSLLCAAAGVGVVLSLPCSTFGSSFEGACGYGAMFTAAGVGLGAFVLSFVLLAVRVGRSIRCDAERLKAQPPAD
ncbi:hypothetical protein [Herbaspirillum robiniae]|uniref:hypothetical protein n=1 Tax=Herbaspirillum robiniae TaxID=2014887 RepID=UPI003D776F18